MTGVGAAERVPPGYTPVRSSLAEPSCPLCLLSLLPFVSKCSTLHPRPFLTLLTGDRALDVQTVATAAKQAVVTCKVSAHRGSRATSFCGVILGEHDMGGPGCIFVLGDAFTNPGSGSFQLSPGSAFPAA